MEELYTKSHLFKTSSNTVFTLHYLTLSNRQAFFGSPLLSQAPSSLNLDETDLISGVYEGGLKIWDCSLDLVQLIADEPIGFYGKTILELGCG